MRRSGFSFSKKQRLAIVILIPSFFIGFLIGTIFGTIMGYSGSQREQYGYTGHLTIEVNENRIPAYVSVYDEDKEGMFDKIPFNGHTARTGVNYYKSGWVLNFKVFFDDNSYVWVENKMVPYYGWDYIGGHIISIAEDYS